MNAGAKTAVAYDVATTRPSNRRERLLLAGGAVGSILFIVVTLIEGATRHGYTAWHHPVSDLSLGPGGWVQVANFIVSGVLLLGFALGLRLTLKQGASSAWAPALFAVSALGLIGAGIFSVDPSLGYPPGAPSASTLHGAIHLLVSNIGEIALVLAFAVLALRFWRHLPSRAWAVLCVAAGVLILVSAVAATAAYSPNPGAPFGFLQRIALIAGYCGVAIVALRLLASDATPDSSAA